MAKKEELTPNSSVVVDGIEIKTYKREITSCNIIEVEVGTTGHMGGDAGHGGRTYLKIRNLSSTDMRPKAYSDNYGHNRVEIVLKRYALPSKCLATRPQALTTVNRRFPIRSRSRSISPCTLTNFANTTARTIH